MSAAVLSLSVCLLACLFDLFSGPVHNLVRENQDLKIYATKVFIGSFSSPFENAEILPLATQGLTEMDVSKAIIYSYLCDDGQTVVTDNDFCVSKPDENFAIGCYSQIDGEYVTIPNSIVHIMIPETKLVEGNELSFAIFDGTEVSISGPNIDTLHRIVSTKDQAASVPSVYSVVNSRIVEINLEDQTGQFDATLLSTDNMVLSMSTVNAMFSEGTYYRFLGNTNAVNAGDLEVTCDLEDNECPILVDGHFDIGVLPQTIDLATQSARLTYRSVHKLQLDDHIKTVSINVPDNPQSPLVDVFVFESTDGRNHIEAIGENVLCDALEGSGDVSVDARIVNVYLRKNVTSFAANLVPTVGQITSNVHLESRLRDLDNLVIHSTTFAANVLSPKTSDINCLKAAIGSFEGASGTIVVSSELVMNGNPEKGLIANMSADSQVVYDKSTKEDGRCAIVDIGNAPTQSLLFTCNLDVTISENIVNITCPNTILYMTPVSLAFPEYGAGLIGVISGIVVILVVLLVVAIIINKRGQRKKSEFAPLLDGETENGKSGSDKTSQFEEETSTDTSGN